MKTRNTFNANDRQPSEIELIKHHGYIYRITNTITGSAYIGEHKHNAAEGWRDYMGSGTFLDQEMKSYGADNFSKEWVAWTENETQALLLEGLHITRQQNKEGFCYNFSNSYVINRDPQENLRHFAFRSSFRPKARLREIIAELTALKEATDDLAEQIALHELRFAHELALKIKRDRFKLTGRLDVKDATEVRS